MNTNVNWTVDEIKAVASLWPLALIVFLTVILIILLFLFLPQIRQFIPNLKNLRVKGFGGEIAVNQPVVEQEKSAQITEAKGTASNAGKTSELEKVSLEVKKDDKPIIEVEDEMNFHLMMGRLDEAEKLFEKLQAETTDPSDRLKREVFYLMKRHVNGDGEAQNKLHEVEARAKESKSTWLGYIIRMDGICYSFSRDKENAANRFIESFNTCVSDSGRVESLKLASLLYYELGEKDKAFKLLKDGLGVINGSVSRSTIFECLANLCKRENDTFKTALFFQRALSLNPNSKDALFNAGYACSEAEFEALAVLHYEKLIEINPKHGTALNNIGVSFSNLKNQSIAVDFYKKAVAVDETLSASNLANIIMNTGMLEDAEKLLKQALTKKNVHENVLESMVKLDKLKKESSEARNKSINLASSQYRFFLGFADAALADDSFKSHLDEEWGGAECVLISTVFEPKKATLEIIWSESQGGKFRFFGETAGLSSKGNVEIWKDQTDLTYALLGGTKSEGRFDSYGNGFIFMNKTVDVISFFIQDNSGQSFRCISFKKTTA